MSSDLAVHMQTVWEHRKTGGRYRIVDTCIIEKTWEQGFIYVYEDDPACLVKIVRPVKEFLDGRFAHDATANDGD